MRNDALSSLGGLTKAHCHPVAAESQAPRQRQSIVILGSLEGRQSGREGFIGM